MDVDRHSVRRRLNRIAGQAAGPQGMVDEDRYCVDVLAQIAAVRSALDAVGVRLLTGHLQHCVARRLSPDADGHGDAPPPDSDKRREQLVAEVADVLKRFLR